MTEHLFESQRVNAPEDGKRGHLVLVCDSSREWQAIDRFKEAAGRLLMSLMLSDSDAQFAFGLYTPSGDNPVCLQRLGWFPASSAGLAALVGSSTSVVRMPEPRERRTALDLAIADAIDAFGADRATHVCFVTDAVPLADGSVLRRLRTEGLTDSDALNRLRERCASIEVIGYSADSAIADQQEGFIADADLRRLGFIDLSPVSSIDQRLLIAELSVSFLAARRAGTAHVEQFLLLTYDSLREHALFSGGSDLDARDAIRRFTKYLDITDDERARLLIRIFRS